MISIEKFSFSNQNLISISKEIRKKVFIEEQEVDPKLEYDEFETSSVHYLLWVDDQAAATCRWRTTDNGIKLERFAVLPLHRNLGLGSELLKRVLDDVIPMKKKIYLNSQLKAVSLYYKQGFRKKGKIFSIEGIDHYYMEYHEK